MDKIKEKLLETSREHWKIESMHWVLDVVFSEDSSAILSENSLKSLNILRKFALMVHKKYVLSQPRKKAYKTSMFDCLLNDNRLLEVLKNLLNGCEIISCNTTGIVLLYRSCKNHCPGFGHSAQSLAAGNINKNAIQYGINTGGNYD